MPFLCWWGKSWEESKFAAKLRSSVFVFCSLSSHKCWHSSFYVCLLMPTEQSLLITLMVFCPSFLLQLCLMWGCACSSAVCSKACWKGVWADVGYKPKCRYRATSAESAASHWCGNFGWRSVTKQLKWAKEKKAKGSNTWNWQLLAPWTDSNILRQGKAQILWLGILTSRVALITKGYLLFIYLLWCCCFARADPILWPV